MDGKRCGTTTIVDVVILDGGRDDNAGNVSEAKRQWKDESGKTVEVS